MKGAPNTYKRLSMSYPIILINHLWMFEFLLDKPK